MTSITEKDAEQQFLFVEKNAYRVVFFVDPLVALLAIIQANHFGILGPGYIAAVGVIVLVNAAVAVNYRLRRNSLRAWLAFLVLPSLLTTGGVAGLAFVDRVFDESLPFSFARFPEQMLLIVLGSLVFLVAGIIWASYGNLRSVRQAELLAAFKQHVLTTAQASILMFFPQGKRPWGPAYFTTMGGIFVSALLAMRFNEVAVWYKLVPIVVSTIMTFATSLLLGMWARFYVSLRPLFRAYGDIEIRRK